MLKIIIELQDGRVVETMAEILMYRKSEGSYLLTNGQESDEHVVMAEEQVVGIIVETV